MKKKTFYPILKTNSIASNFVSSFDLATQTFPELEKKIVATIEAGQSDAATAIKDTFISQLERFAGTARSSLSYAKNHKDEHQLDPDILKELKRVEQTSKDEIKNLGIIADNLDAAQQLRNLLTDSAHPVSAAPDTPTTKEEEL